MTNATATVDLNFNKFVENLYKREPADPFTFSLQFLDEITEADLRKLLGYFVVYGAKARYGKELGQLEADEIEYLRKYLLSIGYNVKFEVVTKEQQLDSNSSEKTLVNYFLIDFFPANRDLDKQNVPPRLF